MQIQNSLWEVLKFVGFYLNCVRLSYSNILNEHIEFTTIIKCMF